jgi:hypothetical protein
MGEISLNLVTLFLMEQFGAFPVERSCLKIRQLKTVNGLQNCA